MNIIKPITAIFLILLSIALSSGSYATPININKADANSLAKSLSGIGKYKAKAIINYRNKNGFFKNAIDIVNVKGIGKGTYNKNKKDILVR
ncbi:MAG: helix-hairpin-helix domain-containing protein [Gammaproteobacteria bacterium]|jgi:competence protein ComEA|nr:helix-hairpin-helix domain-containing protein [Gammaproteobacteria bacterium]MBT4194636.1 helix-hairpin-helix domain-containing protein [Gammaproteobacteria bacterium]MBT4452112.1 helix-hairpin-helix domain-containing protein [Gammaproteobacteria bacterium]MBT4862333.1 helix-hairpin-helix domain-containing protein [Gammaproteobacteria bacterium]